MKKILAILFTFVILLSFSACKDESRFVEETTETTTEFLKPIGLAVGSWNTESGSFYASLVGAELFENEEYELSIRVYIDFTNESKNHSASLDDSIGELVLIQDDEILDETIAINGKEVKEQSNHIKKIRPGITIRTVYQYELEEENSNVRLILKTPDNYDTIFTYTFDITSLPGAPLQPIIIKPVSSPEFSTDILSNGKISDPNNNEIKYNVTIKNIELIEGTKNTKLIRVFFDFTNNNSDKVNFFDTFDLTVYQDGIQLIEGQSKELCSADIAFSTDIEQEQPITVSNTYILTSDSPVEVEITDSISNVKIGKVFKIG